MQTMDKARLMEGNSNRRSYVIHSIPDDAWKIQDARRRYQLARFQEKRSSKKPRVDSETEVQNHEVTVLEDLLLNILILLPAESLFRSQFVCMKWCNLINSSVFIRSHAQQSETVLICRMLTFSKPTSGSRRRSRVPKPESYFHVLNLDGGGPSFIESSIVEPLDILATCDGLVLAAVGKKRSLILTNPVTRKRVALPSVTEGYSRYESFGFAFCKEMNTYKIIHLSGTMLKQTVCNIMSVCEKKWRQIEAPDYELLMHTWKRPVPINGSMSWTPTKEECDYFLSLDLNDEKFVCKKLPVSCSSWDRLVEIEGKLGFVTNLKYFAMHVWIMAGENWIKKYSVGLSVDRDNIVMPIPICCLKDGKGIVCEIGKELVVHKYEGGDDQEMEVIETGEMQVLPGMSESFAFNGWLEKEYMPHRNTLATII